MDIKQCDETDVSKADANSADRLLDPPLLHALSTLIGLQLDGCQSRVQDILNANKYNSWNFLNDFIMKELKEADYEDTDSGKIVKFNKFDYPWFTMFFEFVKYLCSQEKFKVNMSDPCT